jgi:glyoxylate reductase
MARCFVTRRLPGDALERLEAEHDVDVWRERLPPPREELRARASRAEGLLCLLTDAVTAEVIAACPNLRVISNMAVGCDNVDVAAARERGIAVGYTPDVLTETTSDLTFALILAAARRLPEGVRAVAEGEWLTWEPAWLLGRDVHGATLAVVGAGRIGQAVARRAEGFGMQVLLLGRGDRIEDALGRADFVSLHVPLTTETRRMVGEDFLRAMKPTAYLVNTARGGVVDQVALRRALEEGWIAGAALDVTEPEPLPPDDPLLRAPNLIVLPHLGSATHATRERMAGLAVDNLLAGLAGRPLPKEFPG